METEEEFVEEEWHSVDPLAVPAGKTRHFLSIEEVMEGRTSSTTPCWRRRGSLRRSRIVCSKGRRIPARQCGRADQKGAASLQGVHFVVGAALGDSGDAVAIAKGNLLQAFD